MVCSSRDVTLFEFIFRMREASETPSNDNLRYYCTICRGLVPLPGSLLDIDKWRDDMCTG